MLCLDIVVLFESFENPSQVWSLIESNVEKVLENVVDQYTGKEFSVIDYGRTLNTSQRNSFSLSSGSCEVHYFNTIVKGAKFGRILLKDVVRDALDAEDWLKGIVDNPNFVQARLYDREYDFWQNAKDLIHYKSKGKPYEHLPLVSNGLPFPVEQLVVDISKNPGRIIMRDNYIEFVGSVMWLGSLFWRVSGQPDAKRDIMHCEKYEFFDTGSYLKINASDLPFTSASPDSAETQNHLRDLLYSGV